MSDRRLRSALILAVVVTTALAGVVHGQGYLDPGTSGPSPSAEAEGSALPVPSVLPPSWSPVEIAPAFAPSSAEVAVGPLPASSVMTVVVGLAPRAPSSLAGLVSALYTPGTPEYHGFLSPAALADRFGPTSSQISSAESYFEGFGLAVQTSPDHLILSVTGPSGRLGSAFGTTFERFRSPDGGWFVSHTTPATLPALAPWSGAYGLGNVTPLVPADTFSTSTAVDPAAPCSGSTGAVIPCQVWQAYNMTSLISAGTNGTGVRLAVVDAYSSAETQSDLSSDLALFDTDMGIAPGNVSYLYPVPFSGNLNSSENLAWNYEDTLDLEWARAAAPGADIEMTFSPNPGVGLYEAIDWLVAHQAANVISLSWGEPDVGVYNSYNQPCSLACNATTDGSYGILSPVLAFAAAEGISVFAASGDCGAADGTSGVSTNYPASDPDVTGVGGTLLSLEPNGDWLGEIGWSGNETGAQSPGCQNQGGSGGGYSPFPQPWWQKGFVTRSAARGVPDVALDAETGATVIYHGGAAAIGGTSLSTPLWAGIAAIADQYAGGPLGLLNPSLYALAAGANYSADFHDITTGDNGYPAGPGWDPVTGLGTPRVSNLVVGLAHRVSEPASDLASYLFASPRSGKAPLTVTFRVVATGGSGAYPLEGVSFGNENASFAPGGVITYTYGLSGVYSAQAYVADSTANYSLSPPLGVVVGGGSSLNVTLSASTEVSASGSPVLFSAAAKGGVAPYEYNFSFGDGTFLDGSSAASVSHVFGAAGSFCAGVVVTDSATPPDGGASAPAAVAVGVASLPTCTYTSAVVLVASLSTTNGTAPLPVTFNATGAAGIGPPYRYFWNFGDGSNSNDPNGTHVFAAAGVYRVSLTVSDLANDSAETNWTVTVAKGETSSSSALPTVVLLGVGAATGVGAALAAVVGRRASSRRDR